MILNITDSPASTVTLLKTEDLGSPELDGMNEEGEGEKNEDLANEDCEGEKLSELDG